jgi:hypothetical protein
MGDDCPICGKELREGEHYYANPPAVHSYHTDSEGVAKQWRWRSGLEVTPEPEKYAKGTVGYVKYHVDG